MTTLDRDKIEEIEGQIILTRILETLVLLHAVFWLAVFVLGLTGLDKRIYESAPWVVSPLFRASSVYERLPEPLMYGMLLLGVVQVFSLFAGTPSFKCWLISLGIELYGRGKMYGIATRPTYTRLDYAIFALLIILGYIGAVKIEAYRQDTHKKAAILRTARVQRPTQASHVQVAHTQPVPEAVPVRSTGIRRKNTAAFDRLVGLEHAIERIKTALERPFLEPELAKKYKIVPPKGILLYGPAGTGKTSLAKATAEYFNCTFIDASVGLLGPLVGTSEKNLLAVFAYARQHAPAIIWFDEIDKIGRKRDSSNLNRPSDLLLPVLLTEMDGFEPNTGVLVMAATNRPDTLDEALLRPGRFDCKIFVPLPDRSARVKLFKMFLQGVPLAPDFDYEAAAEMTKGASPATIEKAVNEAKNYAASRESAGLGGGVTLADIEAGLAMVTSGIVGGENDGS